MSYIDPAGKLLKHIDRIAAVQSMKADTPPVNVEIDLSNRCSLGCEGCHFAYTHTRGPLAKKAKPGGIEHTGDLLDTALAKSILVQLKAAGVRSVVWSGGGEPTLHPDFEKIIAFNPLPQGIYTNGGHISEERARLLKGRMTWVYVSLDYADKESYLKHKKVDAFDKVIEGVKRLMAAQGKATIGLGFLLWKENWRQMDEMIDLGYELSADYIQFRPMVLYDFRKPAKLAEDTQWMNELIRELEWVQEANKVIVDIDRFRQYAQWKGHGYPVCWWSRLQAMITADGRLWTCVNRRGMEGECLGDLKEEAFMEIWKRHAPRAVDEGCRLMCRGHIPNMALDSMAHAPKGHELFI